MVDNEQTMVSPSASGVAYLRSLHEEISGDVFAKCFVTPEGEALAKKWLEDLPCVAKEVSLRCRWFDSEIKLAIDAGIRQVIQIAAGLSIFPWRYSDIDNFRYAEIDRQEMILFKQEVMKNLINRGFVAPPKSSIDWRGIDLSVDRLDSVCRSLSWDFSRPTLFVLEGISYYLPRDRLAYVINEISQLSPEGSRIAIDYFHDQTEDLPSLERVMGSIAPAGGEASWRRMSLKEIDSLFIDWKITDNESLAEKAKRDGFGKFMDYVSVLSATKLE